MGCGGDALLNCSFKFTNQHCEDLQVVLQKMKEIRLVMLR